MARSGTTWGEPAAITGLDFAGIRKVCGTHRYYSGDDEGYVFILDSGSDNGIIKKYVIDTNTLTTVASTGITLTDDLIMTDMLVIGEGSNEEQPTSWNIWCSAYVDIEIGESLSPGGVLWHATTNDRNGVSTLAFTNRDPVDKSGASENGFGSKYRYQQYALVGGSCQLQSWGAWNWGSSSNHYTALYKRALTYHWEDDYVGILVRMKEITSQLSSYTDGANTWNNETNTYSCYAVNVEKYSHVFIEGENPEREMRHYGTLNWIGVKNTHAANTPINLHHVALDRKVAFNTQAWTGPTGVALDKVQKDLYISSDYSGVFDNGNTWIHVPLGNSMGVDEIMNEPGSVTNHNHGSNAVICDLDWRNKIDIAGDPTNYPLKGLVVTAGTGQKGLWVQGLNATSGEPLGTNYALWDGTNIEVTVGNGQGSTAGQVWNDKKLFYKYSMTYDGYQESPLSEETVTFADSGTYDTLDVTFTIQNTSEINRRVSHINLYRANGSGTGVDKPLGLYRLIESAAATKWANDSPSVLVFEDKSDKVTGSYESRSGISETMTNTTIKWGIGTVASGSLIVGDCGTDEFDDASTYLFKSRPGDYDKFNWALDYLRLPFRPVAIATFQGRVYCWSQDTMLRINPDQFYIEDEYEGFGCLNKRMVCVTEYGMFFGDKNNIYMHNGQAPSPIGTMIVKFEDEDAPSGKGYWVMANSYGDRMVMCLDARRGSIIIFCSNELLVDGQSQAYSYNIANQRWDVWKHTTLEDATTGQDGYIYHTDNQNLTAGSRLIRYLGNSLKRRNWKWHSKRIAAGYPSQEKIHKKIRVISDELAADIKDNLDLDYRMNGNKLTLQLDPSHADYEKVSNSNKKAQDIKFMLETQNNKDLTVRALGSIFRRRPTK